MRKIQKRDKGDVLYTQEDVLNTRDSLKKIVVHLLAKAKITEEQFKERYLEYFTSVDGLSVKKATEQYNNDLRRLRESATITYGRAGSIIQIVLKMTIIKHDLHLMDIDGNEIIETINVQGF